LLCERILRSCREEREAAYAVKILTGELRIGLREGLVLEAIAGAFERDVAGVRRAAMAAGDVGAVAVAARNGALEQIELHYGRPIGFMLASPIAFGSSYRELGDRKWIVEDKYDGIRVQAHKTGSSVRLFTRTFSEISRAFPEVASALAGSDGDLILDGEIVARRDGRVLPFRYLQTRLQRVDPSAQLLAQTPAAFVAFDAIAANQHFLLERTLTERRAELVERVRENDHAIVSPWLELEVAASPARLAALYEAARERGNEGLMLKRADAPYLPGRRGKWWLKLKRELTTLDVVVVGVEWGHGKRNKVLSDYTFAVRAAADSDELLPIGKAYSGLTDAEILQMTGWFLEHQRGPLGAHALAVEPSVVIEVAFDVVAPSTLHASGFALRFPRIVRLRPDKRPDEIDTLESVRRIYAEMLGREGVVQ
jgi:DNA ligase-1